MQSTCRNRYMYIYMYIVLLIIPTHTQSCRAAYFWYANQLTVYTMYKHSDMAITQRAIGTYSTYSSLFSSVTILSPPSGTSSWEVRTPRVSWSTAKYISRPHSSMLFSLWGEGGGGERGGEGGGGGRGGEGREEGGEESGLGLHVFQHSLVPRLSLLPRMSFQPPERKVEEVVLQALYTSLSFSDLQELHCLSLVQLPPPPPKSHLIHVSEL